MAQIEFNRQQVLDSLDYTGKELLKAVEWASKQPPTIALEVPEPFEHSIGPASRYKCWAPPQDECGDIGILIGVFRARKKSLKGSKAKK